MLNTISKVQLSFRPLARLFASQSLPPVINPLQLEETHLQTMYCVSSSEMKSCFHQDLPKKFMNQIDALGQACWILREPSWKIIQGLKERPTNTNRFLLYGPDGCGKTMCLLQSVHYCLKANWIVVYVPSVFKWTHSRHELKPSVKHSGFFDIPHQTCLWLQHFKVMNSKQLSMIKLSRDYVWTKKDSSSAGDDLIKVIELGISRPNISSDVFYAVLNEVTQIENQTVCIAIDDFNGCFNPTSFQYENNYVNPEEINMVRYLLEFVDPRKFTGPVITALSRKLMRHCSITSTDYSELLMNGKGVADSFKTLEVPPFSEKELMLCLEYYSSSKWFGKGLEQTNKSELWYLTGGIPNELQRITSSF